MRFHYRADYRERILMGELSTAPVAVVVDWLKANWREPELTGSEYYILGDDAGRKMLEYVLVRRGGRAINLAIAQYGHSSSAIQKAVNALGALGLYAGASNPRLGPQLSQREFILRKGKRALLRALLQNRFLSGEFIEDLLARKRACADLSDERLFRIVIAITGNERLNRRCNSAYIDGYADYLYHKPFDAAWNLVKTVPVNREWAAALWSLLEKTQPAATFDGVTAAIERWRVDAPMPKPVKWYDRPPSFRVRSLIADRLQADNALVASEDAALRTSFYRRFQPPQFPNWPDFIKEDHGEFFESVLHNAAIWSRPQERQRLYTLAWSMDKADSSFDAVNSVRAARQRFRSLYPEWFNDDDPE
jgi:hypothetical protein